MKKRIYLTSIKWVFELHLILLLIIRKLSSSSQSNDEFLQLCIETAQFTISNLKEDIEISKSQDNNEHCC